MRELGLTGMALTGLVYLGMWSGLSHAELEDAAADRLKQALGAVVRDNDVVGLQVAVARDGRLAWSGAFGKADLEHDVDVGELTLFRTASISKWMTATAAMRLVEEGRLDLDAPIQRYCPEYPEKNWSLSARHLLDHTGGVRHYWGANGENVFEAGFLEKRAKEMAAMSTRHTDTVTPLNVFKDDPLLFEPGTDFQYSSHGYRLLGCVLRGAAERPYREVMQHYVFDPAGMSNTDNDDAWAVLPGRARGYKRVGDELLRSRFRDVSENLPGGGHVSTATDLIAFALAWQDGKLVNRSSMAAMTEIAPDEEAKYGLGINMRKVNGAKILAHSGGQDGTRTMLALDSSTGHAYAWMTNYESIPPGFDTMVREAIERALVTD